MKRFATVLALISLLAGAAAATEKTSGLPETDFKFFKIVSERNIFNPKRTKYVPPAPKPKPVVIETFALVGALGDERGRMAFFDSGNPEFCKAFKAGESIGGLKILQIDFNRARLFS